ncbi:hypothetical protein Dimus_005233, partial [Dionaea muscipula]
VCSLKKSRRAGLEMVEDELVWWFLAWAKSNEGEDEEVVCVCVSKEQAWVDEDGSRADGGKKKSDGV